MYEKFRVWHLQNIPNNDAIYYYVQSPSHGKRVIRSLIELDLLRQDMVR